MKFYRLTITNRYRMGPYVVLQYPWGGPVQPGQFVMARHAGYPVTLEPFLARPLSVYDYDGELASLLFEVRGRGTALLDQAESEIEVSEPLGKQFTVDISSSDKAALLGGGVGIAPMKILSRRLEKLGVGHEVYLGFSEAGPAASVEDFPGAVVSTIDGSVGVRGTVLDAVESLDGYSTVYACGPNPMLAAVKRAVGQEAFCELAVEERMGCGNGSCTGCAVPVRGGGYARACVDGPVFEAEVLAW